MSNRKLVAGQAKIYIIPWVLLPYLLQCGLGEA